MEYAIIVPVYRGAERIAPFLDALDTLKNLLPPSGEIVFVDDGSDDDTWKALSRASRGSTGSLPLRALRLAGNKGQQTALLAGMSAVNGKAVITMDDDLSHPPHLLGPLLEALNKDGADLAYAAPPARPGGLMRRAASRLHQLNMNLITLSSPAIRVGSYRALSAALSQRIMEAPEAFPYLSAIALGLRPRPSAVMVKSPLWERIGEGRFSLSALMVLEARLLLHHNPAARQMRRRHAKRTVEEAAQAEIAEILG